MSEKLNIPADVQAALVSFRSKALDGGRHYLVLGYEGKNTLHIEAQGEGFADDAKKFFADGECRYAYLRTDHKVELTNTTRFALADWTPDSVPPMRRALVSQHKAQVAQALQPVHVSVQASRLDEVSDDIILDKIGASSGTKSNVTAKAAFSAAAVDISRSTAAKEADYLPAAAKSSRTMELADEGAIKQAFKDVRADSVDVDWALLGFVQDGAYKTLELKRTGTGGPAALAAALDASQPQYALFRTREQIDQTNAVRFSFLRVVPTSLPPAKKAHIGTLNGVIRDLFLPFAYDFDFSDASDFSPEAVQDKISGLSGTKNHSMTAAAAAGSKVAHPLGAQSSPSNSGAGPSVFVAQPSGSIQVDDALRDAIRALRSDADPTTWLVAGRGPSADSLTLLASGSGDRPVDALKAHLPAGDVSFALLRVIDQIDRSSTVKFVYVRSQPESTPALRKSAVSTKLGLYNAVFHPFSSEFFIAQPDELTQEGVQDKVAAASGSKSNIVDKK